MNRRAFTLIELLVVLAVIGVLLGLLLPAVRRAGDQGKRLQASTEGHELALAASQFKARFGVPVYVGEFRLATTYSGAALNWPEIRFLKECWPNIDLNDTGYRNAGYPVDWTVAIVLKPNEAVSLCLTGGLACQFQGFSTNPRRPLTPPTGTDKRVGPFAQSQNNEQFQQDGLFRDPWRSQYTFALSGSHLQVTSMGRDKVLATEDDVICR